MNPSAALFCICMIAVYSAGEKPSTGRNKREVSGLYPFPRVGKGDVSWSSQMAGPREMKRQGLIPFPRVGRNRDNEDLGKKRDVTENGGGMWFGPRLGRLQKKNYLDEDSSWALIQTADYPQVLKTRDFLLPKPSRESSEEAGLSREYRL